MTSKKKKKEGSDIVSGSSDSGDLKLFSFGLPVFLSDQINEAAEKAGMNRASFVRKALADAIVAQGIALMRPLPDVKHGSRKDLRDPKKRAGGLAQIASARAVKAWKQSLPSRHEPWMVEAIIQTWDTAAAKIGRKLTVDELERCERECVMLAKMADESKGPPNFGLKIKIEKIEKNRNK